MADVPEKRNEERERDRRVNQAIANVMAAIDQLNRAADIEQEEGSGPGILSINLYFGNAERRHGGPCEARVHVWDETFLFKVPGKEGEKTYQERGVNGEPRTVTQKFVDYGLVRWFCLRNVLDA